MFITRPSPPLCLLAVLLVPFVLQLGSPNNLPAEQLEAHGAGLCQRSVMTLFDNNASVKAALETGTEPQVTCADWEMSGEGHGATGIVSGWNMLGTVPICRSLR
jgi:hypothetical protein